MSAGSLGFCGRRALGYRRKRVVGEIKTVPEITISAWSVVRTRILQSKDHEAGIALAGVYGRKGVFQDNIRGLLETHYAASPAVRAGKLQQTAVLYDMFAASRDVTRPVGEFNHPRLVVKGGHVAHWLNGEKVMNASLKAPEIAQSVARRWGADSPVYHLLVDQPRKRCQISLQNHDDVAWFKNIRIRRL